MKRCKKCRSEIKTYINYYGAERDLCSNPECEKGQDVVTTNKRPDPTMNGKSTGE